MEIVKGNPIFPSNIIQTQYPYLTENIDTEVLIVGGGCTGALALWYFTQKGIPCVLIDSGRFAMRSTSITTALLQYELDDNYESLVKVLEESNTKKAYKIGIDALSELENIIEKIGNKCDYEKNDCLLMTKNPLEKQKIKNEYNERNKMGIDVRFLERKNNPFPFNINSGVYSKNGGARLNPYLFTHQLLASSKKNNAKIYENTKAISASYSDLGVTVKTEYGNTISAKNIVVATGYDISTFTDNVFCEKYITYNIVTKPIKNLPDLKVLVRDNKTKYHYFRQTIDKRIILGGEDILLTKKGIDEIVANNKYEILTKYLKRIFPDSSEDIKIDYSYCGVFGTTKDNLGVVGADAVHPQLLYCLGYGANGILFAIMGAKMLSEQYLGVYQKDLDIFSPLRATIL